MGGSWCVMAGQSLPPWIIRIVICLLLLTLVLRNKLQRTKLPQYQFQYTQCVYSAIEPVKNYQTAGHRSWTNIYETTALVQPGQQREDGRRSNQLTKMHESIEIIKNYSEKSD